MTSSPVATAEHRRRDLRAMKRRATGVLVAVTGVFVAVVVLGEDTGWTGYVRAAAEGSMVGGLADWFAVTAIFRHPLGLPIPHTAVIRARKDQFGETLGTFVQENFLSAGVVGDRLHSARIPERLTTWLLRERNAELVARHIGDVVVSILDVVRDEDVQRVLDEEIDRAVHALPVAAIAGRAVRVMTTERRHQEVFDSVVRALGRTLEQNRPALRDRFGQDSPWWLPDAVEDRVFDRILGGVTALLESIDEDPDHEARAHFDAWVKDLADRLETSPDMHARVDQLKKELLANPQLRAWSASIWTDLKTDLRRQVAEPDSELRRRLAGTAVALGRRLQDDPALQSKLDELLQTTVRSVGEQFADEIAGLVSATVAGWDAEETSDKLELLLGRDLQYIRINGTVVGGLAGLALHAGSQVLG